MRHGYTNSTVGDGATVLKRYAGPRAAERAEREHVALTALAERVPVPAVLGRAPGALTLEFVAGGHGQDLIAAGHADRVLVGCGGVLRRIHAAGFTHGDFGPNNTLLDPDSLHVTAVLDWEFSSSDQPGGPAEAAWHERLGATAAWPET